MFLLLTYKDIFNGFITTLKVTDVVIKGLIYLLK